MISNVNSINLNYNELINIFHLLAKQFKRTMLGDRFFFTHKKEIGSFTKKARKTLINRSLAGIICDNTAITAVPANVFLVTPSSDYINCEDTPSLGNISSLLEFE